MPYDWINNLIGYNPQAGMTAGSSGVPLDEPATEEEMTPFKSPYDPETLQYRLAQGRSMQGERPPLPVGGNRRERAVTGLMTAGRGIADWLKTRSGEGMEKGAMADLMAYKEIKTNWKKEFKGKVDKEFDKLYNSSDLDDKQAIMNLRKLAFNGRLSFSSDPEILNILNNMDKSIDGYMAEKVEENYKKQEAGWKERELAVKEKPEVTKPLSIEEQYKTGLKAKIDTGTATPEEESRFYRMLGGEAKTEKLPITLDQQINRVKDAIEFIAPTNYQGKRQVPDTKKDPVGAKRYEELIKTYNRLLLKAVSEVEEPQTLPDITIPQSGVESDDEIIADELRRAGHPVTPENIQRIKALLEGK